MADYRQHQKLVKVHTMLPSLKQEFDDQSSAHFRGSGLIDGRKRSKTFPCVVAYQNNQLQSAHCLEQTFGTDSS